MMASETSESMTTELEKQCWADAVGGNVHVWSCHSHWHLITPAAPSTFPEMTCTVMRRPVLYVCPTAANVRLLCAALCGRLHEDWKYFHGLF